MIALLCLRESIDEGAGETERLVYRGQCLLRRCQQTLNEANLVIGAGEKVPYEIAAPLQVGSELATIYRGEVATQPGIG